MLNILLIVIFISFIGVGLPDSVLGTAWPSMYREFNLPISLAGYITSTVSIGTIISSLLSARFISKLGVGGVTAVSTLLTAVSLLGFALTENPVFFFILAVPLGLGAGSIDTALNGFAAVHYSASKLNFLHSFYGFGVAASPFIMSLALGDTGNWQRGYFIIASVQFFITAVAFLFLPLWKKVQKFDTQTRNVVKKRLSIPQLIKTKGVIFSCLSFFTICALELTAGAWSSSFFVNEKGIKADKAASITMLLYIGLTVGRILSGFFSERFGSKKVLWVSLFELIASVTLFALPLPTAFSAAALFFIGLGLGPVYPNLVHLTPRNFGEDIVESVMGLQQAFTYLGIMLMPWLFGIIAQKFSVSLLPFFLLAMWVLYALSFTMLMKRVKND